MWTKRCLGFRGRLIGHLSANPRPEAVKAGEEAEISFKDICWEEVCKSDLKFGILQPSAKLTNLYETNLSAKLNPLRATPGQAVPPYARRGFV